MDKEVEKCIFNSIRDVFDDGCFLSSTSINAWPDFFRIIDNEVYICKTKHIGWSTDGPREVLEKLDHISTSIINNFKCLVTYEDRTQEYVLSNGPAKHYYGR